MLTIASAAALVFYRKGHSPRGPANHTSPGTTAEQQSGSVANLISVLFGESYDNYALDCSNSPGSLPRATQTAGTFDSSNPIEHIIVIMQENHTFDSQLGALTMADPTTGKPALYSLPKTGKTPTPTTVDGLSAKSLFSNPGNNCQATSAHFPALCPPLDPEHGWDPMHKDWDEGLNDQFVATNGSGAVMGYFTQSDLPYYYWLATQFAIGDRYFSSVMGPTWPNRSYLYAATSFGIISTYQNITAAKTPTVFDLLTDGPNNPIASRIRASLSAHGISYPGNQPLWKYYSDAGGAAGLCKSDGDYIQQLFPQKNYPCAGTSDGFVDDVASGNLALVSFVDADLWGEEEDPGTSEHPGENVQNGQAFVAKVVQAILATGGTSGKAQGYWGTSAIFLTYDEGGGFYDHVPPPAACAPDAIAPIPVSSSTSASNNPSYAFDNLGFRVPITVISPYAKHHYVSHKVYDHTSILKFIENKFNLPALTKRDANADAMMDFFDFSQTPQAAPQGAPATSVTPCPETQASFSNCN